MDANVVFMQEITKIAVLPEIGGELEAGAKAALEGGKKGWEALKGIPGKYPKLTTGAGLGAGLFALHQWHKRREAERKLGM